MKYGFVVLNYNNYADTIECVRSILAIPRSDYRIVIVDNNSPNDSFRELHAAFDYCEVIYIVKSDKNLGYSGGNNIGIRRLMAKGIKNIIIATNDTVIVSRNILDKFDEIAVDRVGIVGPNIVTPEGVFQNPPRMKPDLLYLLLVHFYIPWTSMREWLYRRVPFIRNWRKEEVQSVTVSLIHNEFDDREAVPVYMLHGAFFLLTENFLANVGLLDENIFMYWEEDLLAWQCEKAGLSRVFLPGVNVLHKDRKSTTLSHNDKVQEFIRLQNLQSRKYVASQVGVISLLRTIFKYRFAPVSVRGRGFQGEEIKKHG